MSDCCSHSDSPKAPFDFILWGSSGVILLALLLHFTGFGLPYVEAFSHKIIELLKTMWWGIALGIFFVGIMNKIPREYFRKIMGRGDTLGGITRAAVAGLLLDLCSHGILMIGAKLYERGASVAQVMTFLIASPWNSLSLTLILIALIGLKWTLLFIAGSALIAVITGIIFDRLTKNGVLPENPHSIEDEPDFSILEDAKARLKDVHFGPRFFIELVTGSLHEARILIKWLLLGVVLAGLIHTFVPEESFAAWFGPSLFGLFMTLIATSIIEVCSEGSAPIAAEIMGKAAAPGNAFTFLMAGVATDYTEILVLKDTTKSWKIALFLPLVTVPQVVVLGMIMNLYG